MEDSFLEEAWGILKRLLGAMGLFMVMLIIILTMTSVPNEGDLSGVEGDTSSYVHNTSEDIEEDGAETEEVALTDTNSKLTTTEESITDSKGLPMVALFPVILWFATLTYDVGKKPIGKTESNRTNE